MVECGSRESAVSFIARSGFRPSILDVVDLNDCGNWQTPIIEGHRGQYLGPAEHPDKKKVKSDV